MDVPVTLPLDSDGFLRRECPHCIAQFKWHHGPANEEAEKHPDPPTYYCPLCGQPASPDSWWTQEQLDYAQESAAPAIAQFVDESVDELFRGMKRSSIRVERSGHLDVPDAPAPLVEPDGMCIVMSPCHSYEPIKVPDEHTGPLHCLVCGTAFAV
jgi:hypothetical protein